MVALLLTSYLLVARCNALAGSDIIRSLFCPSLFIPDSYSMEFVYLLNVECDIIAPRAIIILCTLRFSRAEQGGLERTVYVAAA